MCGIVGYTGPREAGPILLEGLRRLEYRGYDSAGIALVDTAGDLFVEKRAGKLANLTAALGDSHAARGDRARAHTLGPRTAAPNDLNAHPHQDCTGDITVIHNGIIENFQTLRDMLESEGHVLRSETDTEVIAHLIEDAYGGDLAEAVRAALTRIEGAYSLVIMHKGESDRLVGARMNVPLVVGLGDARRSSPATSRQSWSTPGASSSSRKAMWPMCGRGASRSPGSMDRRMNAVVTEITWTPEAAEKGGYEHFMLKEMTEQPQGAALGHHRSRDPRGPAPPRRAGQAGRCAP